jgi:two-component system sensor histidine kinase KdpD
MNAQKAKLVIYLGSVPGVGKTYRLLQEGIAAHLQGIRVVIGWVESKQRPRLDELASRLPQLVPRLYRNGEMTFADFDLEAALASEAELIVLDELAHSNPRGAVNAKRWQDALALRAAGKSVLTACNVYHLESIAPFAERVTEFPITEIVPMHVILTADQVTAIDVPLERLQQRLSQREIIRPEDIPRASRGIFRPRVVQAMRDFLFRVVDEIATPNVAPSRTSRALALVLEIRDPSPFLARVAALAANLNLLCDVAGEDETEELAQAITEIGAQRIPLTPFLRAGELHAVQATLVAVPNGKLAERIVRHPLDRSLFIADSERRPLTSEVGLSESAGTPPPVEQHGMLTIYLGAIAGCGKTYAMLDRAQQLLSDGIDAVGAFIETHGRRETSEMIGTLPLIARRPSGEMDLEAVLCRRPKVALIDELAHTNTPEATHRKRYEDVLALLAAGIDVLTTLNIQHIEGVGASVERLTATRVRETVPDSLLEMAGDVVFIDVSPDVLQQRLRDVKIYPPARVETALANFFRFENLVALRELAVRELLRARGSQRWAKPFARMLLGVAPREQETRLIAQAGQTAKRMRVPLWTFCITPEPLAPALHERFTQAAAAADGIFIPSINRHPAEAFAALAGANDLLVVASPRKQRAFFGKSFALRCLEAGAKELLVIAAPIA